MLFKSLSEYIDTKLLLVLRDNRILIGFLRSYDQYANLILQDTVERIYHKNTYADIPRGIFLVRGENVLYVGEVAKLEEVIKRERDCGVLGPVDVGKVLEMQQSEIDRREKLNGLRKRIMRQCGSIEEIEGGGFI